MTRHIAIVMTLAMLICTHITQAQVSPEERQAAKTTKAKEISELKKAEEKQINSGTTQRAEKINAIKSTSQNAAEEKKTLTQSPESIHNTEKKTAVDKRKANGAVTVQVEETKNTDNSQALQEKQALIDAEKQKFERASAEEKKAILMQKAENPELTDAQKLAIKMEIVGLEGKQSSTIDSNIERNLSLEEKIEMKINQQIEEMKKTGNFSSQDTEKLRQELREQYVKKLNSKN